MTQRYRTLAKVIAIAAVNGLMIGGALAATHREHWVAMAAGISIFVASTYAVSSRVRR